MKKFLLMLMAILSLVLVSCDSGTSGTVTNQLSAIFTQEEQTYVTEQLKTIPSDYKILEKNINGQVINFTIEFTLTDINDNVIVDENGDTVKIKVKEEIKKLNNLCYMEDHVTSSFQNTDEIVTNYDLSIQRLFSDYNPDDYFTQSQYDAFASYLADNPSQVAGIAINPDYSSNDSGITSLDLYIKKGTEDIYNASIFKSNGKYIAADKFGILATEDTLVAIFTNKKVTDKIDDVILANADTAKNISKSISTTSKKSTYDFHNIFKK